MDWKALIRFSAAVLGLLLAAAAIGLRDIEAAVMAVGAIVALGLLRFRSGLLGLLGLCLLSANVAVWMTPGALSNLTHGEGFWETALPSALTVASITTLIAAMGAIAGRRSRDAGARAARPLALTSVVVLGAALGLTFVGAGKATRAQAGDIRLVAEQVRFSSTELDADTTTVGVYVANKDLFWHTFTVKALDVNLNVPVGAERRIEFTAAPGTYEFICRIPGHTQAGMKGTLTVR
jgi:plastocyanin